MRRTWVIAQHTFFESVGQPIFWLLAGLGVAAVGILASLPFFTLGDDVRMFKDVALDVILILALLASLFTASRAVHDEIEDRTMLTLMSKPLRRWEVLVGKYLGLAAASALFVVALGAALQLAVYYRVPGDYLLSTASISESEQTRLTDLRAMHLAGGYAAALLVWLQVSVLTAAAVALSTRFSLVVTLPAVVLLYLAGNLLRFVDAATQGRGALARGSGFAVETVLPYLAAFDLRSQTVYADLAVPGTSYAAAPGSVAVGTLWVNTALSGAYAAAFVTFTLCVGLLMFRNRELGGSEG